MTLAQFCEKIALPDQVPERVLSVPAVPEALLVQLRTPELWPMGRAAVKAYLKPDDDGFGELAAQLQCALKTWETYRFSEEIFVETMKCFTRFVREHLESYGRYGFDRGFNGRIDAAHCRQSFQPGHWLSLGSCRTACTAGKMRSKAASRGHTPGRSLLLYRTGLGGIFRRKASTASAVATIAEAATEPLATIATAIDIAMAAITIAATAVAIIIIRYLSPVAYSVTVAYRSDTETLSLST